MKKRFVALALASSLTFSMILSACSSTDKAENAATEDVVTEKSDDSTDVTSTGDGSRQFYESTFVASGTNSDVYNNALEDLKESFVSQYTESGEIDQLGGYDEPISVSVTGWYSAAGQDAMAKWGDMYGESMEYHRWFDLAKQLFNVDIEYGFMTLADDYDQKLRLDMTAGDLPDIFLVKNQSDLAQLIESGAVQDLTSVAEEYVTKDIETIWESDGGKQKSVGIVDNKLYALPMKISDTDNFSYLWIRSDWMEALNLENPTNMEELEAIIEAFVNADFDGNGKKDTVGMVMYKDIYYHTRGLFNAYGAYPEIWEEKDGVLSWGGINENNKEALALLADWYQKGYIKKEFITQDSGTALEDVIAGNCGVVYGGHWLGHTFGDAHELDPNVDWRAVMLPTGNGEEVVSPLVVQTGNGWLVVNSEFEYPELAVKLIAMMRAGVNCDTAAWWWYEDNVSWNFSPIRSTVSSFDNLFTYQNLMEAYENNNDTSLLKGKANPYWENLHGELAWEWEEMFGPADDTPMVVLEESYENDKLFYDSFYGAQGQTMQDKWPTIKDEQLIAFTKIIIGEVGVEEGFNQWLNTFESMGGNEVTEEVNEWYQGLGK